MASYAEQAKAAADVRFLPEESNLKVQQQLAAAKAAADLQALQGWGQTGQTAINTSFDQLLSDMGQNRAQAANVINNTVGNIGVGYDQLAQQNLMVRDEGRQYLANLMHSLGQSDAALADVSSPLENLTQQLYQRNSGFGQAQRDILRNWGTQHDVLYGDQMVNARGRQASEIGSFNSQIADLMAQAQNASRERDIDLQSRLMSILGQRGGFEVDYGQQLANEDYGRQLEQAKLAAQVQEANARLELQRRAQEFEERQATQGPNPWEVEKFYASLGLDTRKQDFQEWLAAQEMANKPSEYSGISGARTYAQQMGDPTLTDLAQGYIAMAQRDPSVAANPDALGQIAENLVSRDFSRGVTFGSRPSGSVSQEDLMNVLAILTGRY